MVLEGLPDYSHSSKHLKALSHLILSIILKDPLDLLSSSFYLLGNRDTERLINVLEVTQLRSGHNWHSVHPLQ